MLQILKFITKIKLRSRNYKLIGVDEYQNKYYLNLKNSRRICEYYGMPEPTKVPSNWHMWLHGYGEDPQNLRNYFWQINHTPNFTGTSDKYVPQGAISKIKERRKINSKKYKPWQP